jgi:hypothetical protein
LSSVATQAADQYSCTARDASGPELVYSFMAAEQGEVTVTLIDMGVGQDMDLYVLEDQGAGPDQQACITFHSERVSWEAEAGRTYYVVVDGYAGSAGSFTLQLDCSDRIHEGPATGSGGDDDDSVATGDDDDSVATGDDDDSVAAGDDDDSVAAGDDDDSLATGDDDDDDSSPGTSPSPALSCAVTQSASCGATVVSDTTDPNATSMISGYSCSSWDASGPELVYAFVASASGPVTASLSSIEAGQDLDIYVLEDVGTGCDADQCLAYGNSSATFTAVAGQTYYLVVDGYNGAAGSFTLEVGCGTSSGGSSSGGSSSGGSSSGGSTPPSNNGTCNPGTAMTCGGTLISDTTYSSASSLIDGYSCSSWDASGPELVYSFVPANSGDVTASLSSIQSGQDLDIYVLEEDGTGCASDQCIAYGNSSATFTVVAGQTYYIVVDGYYGAAGSFTLEVNCSSSSGGSSSGSTGGSASGGSTPASGAGTCTPGTALSCGNSLVSDTTYGFADSLMDSYSCSTWDASGPELVYSFVPTTSGSVTASLSSIQAGQDLDLYVLEEDGSGCAADQCIAYGNTSATFSVVAGQNYYLVVDGYYGAAGDFTLDVSCAASSGSNSGSNSSSSSGSNSGSNSSSTSGSTGGSCTVGWIATCASPMGGDTTGSGASDDLDGYSCSSWDASGPEDVYEFIPTVSGAVTAELSWIETGEDLDVYILEDTGAGCDQDECIEFGNLAATWNAVAGQTYFVVVDGYNGAAGAYTLDLSCPGSSTGPGAGSSTPTPTPSQAPPFVDRTHCLDWNTVNITSPSSMASHLSSMGINLSDYPVLLGTTSVDEAAGEISMLAGSAIAGSCGQDLSQQTYDLTAAQAGTYSGGHFAVGPADMEIALGTLTVQLYDVEIEGDFSSDGTTITGGTLVGELDISNLSLPWGACTFALNCHSCPTGGNDCVTFEAEAAVLNDNGEGVITAVP